MTLPLPDRPSLRQLKIQARELLSQLLLNDASAQLADAQLLIARQYGFSNWQNLHAHVDELTEQRLGELAETFRKFAVLECRDRSASYECWASHIAEDEELLRIAAFGRTPIPNLFLAVVQLLVLENPVCELAQYYASVNRNPLPAEAGWGRFRNFCLKNRHEIVQLMRARTTQTNEVRRSAYLAAAFNVVWKMGGNKPLALIEIGTSAGLSLCFDKYAFRIGDNVLGNRESSLILAVESRGQMIPPIPRPPLTIGPRIGIDLRPIPPDDAEGFSWLNALIWPEHHDRRVELAAALQIAANVPRQLIAGDAVAILGDVLRGVPPEYTLCVFQTHSFNQIPSKGRERLLGAVKETAAKRPVYFISRHGNLTLDCFGVPDQSSTSVLAETDPHGRWIEWLIPG